MPDPMEIFPDMDEETLVYPDLEGAFVGLVERYGQPPIVCYNKAKVLKQYQKDGMTADEALEYFYFNTLGAGLGDTTPCFITLAPRVGKKGLVA